MALPKQSIFESLYYPQGGAGMGWHPQWSGQVIEELQINLSPRVKNKTVFWMLSGLSGAFGDKIYYPSLVPFNPGHPIRNENKMTRSLLENPPDFIVTIGINADYWDRHPLGDAYSFFQSRTLHPWLRQYYKDIWLSSNITAPLVLWEKRTTLPHMIKDN
jgi:hypothetical protein